MSTRHLARLASLWPPFAGGVQSGGGVGPVGGDVKPHLTRLTGLWPPFIAAPSDTPEPTPSLVPLRVGLVAAVKADATLAGLIGGRIRPGYVPMKQARPGICYRVASDNRGSTLAGQTNQRIARVIFDCHASTDIEAEEIARALDVLLGGFTGSLGGCNVRGCIQQPEDDLYDDPPGNGTDGGTFIRSVDYRFDYRLDLA